MIPANVKLSKSELTFVSDPYLILTKNRIIEKVNILFGLLADEFRTALHDCHDPLFAAALRHTPKIYNGENYQGLPYVMLDYPRYFTREDACAIRSFFWWGNFFSITLHLSGKYAAHYAQQLAYGLLQPQHIGQWHYCIHAGQWQHHFEPDHYACIAPGVEKETLISTWESHGFIKIAKKLPMKDWELAFDFFKTEYTSLMELLGLNRENMDKQQ